MKTKGTLLAAIIFLLLSCDDDSQIPIPEPTNPTIYEYVYTGKHEKKDFNIYVGPKGEKVEKEYEFVHNFWGEYTPLGTCPYDTLIIDRAKDSLYFKYNKTTHRFPLKQSNDTLWFSDTEYWGILFNEKDFLMNKAFYFINHKGKQNEGSNIWFGGYRGDWNTYEKAKIERLFHENSVFHSFADMTMGSDTLAWLTEYYEFKLTREY